MNVKTPELVFQCPAEEISSYIDGELSAEQETALESHLKDCEVCRNELNEQKGFLIALSDTLEREIEVELPENFAKTIVVNAESEVVGLRGRSERRSALMIVSGMLILAAAILGGSLFGPVRSAFEKVGAVLVMISQVAFDLIYGLGSFIKSFVSAQTFSGVAAYIALSFTAIAAVYFISRSLRRFFRTQGSE